MITIVLALCGQCGAQACVNRIVTTKAVVATPYVAHVAHHAYEYKPFFAYKVPDPEVERLQRQNEKLQEALIEELRERRKEVQQLRATTEVVETASEPTDPVEILKQSCGKCHTDGKAKGDFAFDVPPTVVQKLQIADAIRRGTMPPPSENRLTEKQLETLTAYLALNAGYLKEESKAKKKG